MPTYPIPGSGTDKHHGKYLSYIYIDPIFADDAYDGDTLGAETFFGWSRVSMSGSVEVRENTNAGSKMREYQVMREEPPSAEIEFYLPYNEEDGGAGKMGAKRALRYIRAGVLINSNFNVLDQSTPPQSLFDSAYMGQFGKWIIERSSVDISRDELTTVRATIRAMGYVDASVDWT